MSLIILWVNEDITLGAIQVLRNDFFLEIWHPPLPRNTSLLRWTLHGNASLHWSIYPYPIALLVRNTWMAPCQWDSVQLWWKV